MGASGMSEDVFSDNGVLVSTYAGPERADGGPRKRWQIMVYSTLGDDGFFGSFSAEQWETLRQWFRADNSYSVKLDRDSE
jgi:hypothetical protein